MGSETGVGCRLWFASASPRAPRSRTSFRVAPYGDASVIMARNNATFLFGLLTEHGGYPRVAGLGAAVERKIKLIRESRLMPGPERQLAQSRFPRHAPTPEPRAATACDRHIVTCVILPKPSGARLRTFALARSSRACNFSCSAAAAALVGKYLLARRRVWPSDGKPDRVQARERVRRAQLFRAALRREIEERRPVVRSSQAFAARPDTNFGIGPLATL